MRGLMTGLNDIHFEAVSEAVDVRLMILVGLGLDTRPSTLGSLTTS